MIIGINATGSVVQYGYLNKRDICLKTISQQKDVEQLPNLIGEIIDAVDSKPTKIVSITGPGSYTGIRISLTVAKMIAAIHNISVLGCPLFESYMMVQSLMLKELVFLTSNSRKGYVNAQLFQSNDSGSEPISSILQLSYQQLQQFLNRFDSKIKWHHLNEKMSTDLQFSIDCDYVEFPFQQFLALNFDTIDSKFSDLSLIYSSTKF